VHAYKRLIICLGCHAIPLSMGCGTSVSVLTNP
jgi:hypothetical protein